MALKIGICDDQEAELRQIGDLLRQVAAEEGCPAELRLFRRSAELLAEIGKDPLCFDVLFLDLYIDEAIGFDVAREVRRRNRRCSIVFFTAFADRMAESFRFLPSAYLVKPVGKESLRSAFRTALAHLDAAPCLHLHLKGEELAVPLGRILYFESRLKDVRLFCDGEKEPVVFKGKLAEIEGLPPEYFHRCHKSFLVNFSHALRVDKAAHAIVMRNGARVPVSRRYYRQILRDFTEFHAVRRTGM